MQKSDFKSVKLNAAQLKTIASLEIQYFNMADLIESNVPSSAHRTAALRKLFESKMTAVHAISRGNLLGESLPTPIKTEAFDEGAACNPGFEARLRSQGY